MVAPSYIVLASASGLTLVGLLVSLLFLLSAVIIFPLVSSSHKRDVVILSSIPYQLWYSSCWGLMFH